MNLDKENLSAKINSKIPVPVEPLPALPQHILKRRPLKTINQQTIKTKIVNEKSGAIKANKEVKPKTTYPLKIDTKYVTVRQNTKDLDWEYQIFNEDKTKESTIVVINDDEGSCSEKGRVVNYLSENKQKNCYGETKKVETPTFKSPLGENNRIKNIKKSLKRPHSRELQGLSPEMRQERGDEKHRRRLLFNESLQDTLQSPDCTKRSLMTCLNRDYTEDLFTYLLKTETKTAIPAIPSAARACLINWLMKLNGPNGNPSTVQTARWYFDSVLAAVHVQIDKWQLIAAACYWIAQKINGHVVRARKLVKSSCGAFTTGHLLAAEKAILMKLNFPTQPVLPQEYISYLSWCCDSTHPGDIEVAATFLCIAGLMVDKVLCCEWPSVIGAAAVRNAVLLLRRDCILKLQMNPLYQAAEQKTSNISIICSIQRKAVRLISSSLYEYKAPLEHYGIPPYYIAQKIISSCNELARMESHKKEI